MKRLAIILTFLLVSPTPMLAGNWQTQNTPASDCDSLGRACTAAARELIAARKLIAGYESHIAASDQRIRIAERQIEALKEKGALETLRASELETVIRIEREKIALMTEEVALLKKRVSQLEGRARFWRKAAGFFGVAAGVAILIVAAK